MTLIEPTPEPAMNIPTDSWSHVAPISFGTALKRGFVRRCPRCGQGSLFKGYLTMGILMLVQCCVTLTKTVRDVHESTRMVNRIEDAKAERLLMEVSKAA